MPEGESRGLQPHELNAKLRAKANGQRGMALHAFLPHLPSAYPWLRGETEAARARFFRRVLPGLPKVRAFTGRAPARLHWLTHALCDTVSILDGHGVESVETEVPLPSFAAFGEEGEFGTPDIIGQTADGLMTVDLKNSDYPRLVTRSNRRRYMLGTILREARSTQPRPVVSGMIINVSEHDATGGRNPSRPHTTPYLRAYSEPDMNKWLRSLPLQGTWSVERIRQYALH